MNIKEYQESQEEILYSGEVDRTHSMFLDLDDMVRWCTRCKAADFTEKGMATLRAKCRGASVTIRRPTDIDHG